MLHTVNHSPFRSDSLESCVRFLLPGDVLLLMEDAVLGVMENSAYSDLIKKIMENNEVCALEPDLKMRGVSRAMEGVKKIDYDGFVELVEKHQITSWL